MARIKWIAALALAVPAAAMAQVGPNPAVQGSQDPTVGPSSDRLTAPDDAAIGDRVAPGTATPPSAEPAEAGDEPMTTKQTTAPTSESTRKPR